MAAPRKPYRTDIDLKPGADDLRTDEELRFLAGVASDEDAYDELLRTAQLSGIAYAQKRIGAALTSGSVVDWYECWSDRMRLSRNPASATVALSYVADGATTFSTLMTTDYRIDDTKSPPCVVVADPPALADDSALPIKISYQAGENAGETVFDEDVRMAVNLLVRKNFLVMRGLTVPAQLEETIEDLLELNKEISY